jgi:MFS family permease
MQTKGINKLVIVAALGYFVDIYDLILFGIVRNPSLQELGYSGNELLEHGVDLLNMQMLGMLVGGILWGVLGDVKGRISVLFGSIFMYSAANIANGMVTDINTYAIIRFIAGVGLAGELGAGITLVSETMHKDHRGWGTMTVVVFGALGAVLAAVIGDYFNWRVAYYVGGGLGMLLLVMRVGALESGMFAQLKHSDVKKGAFLSLFTDSSRFKRYFASILIGLPVWFTIGILIIFSPEFGKALNIEEPVQAGKAIMYAYIGLSVGDLISGVLSQVWRSRKKVVLLFIVLNMVFTLLFLFSPNASLSWFYMQCFLLGAATGFWALFVTIAAEQFGTNLRSTVTTTVPNFVRGAVYPMTSIFILLKVSLGIVTAALVVGTGAMLLALFATLYVKETFGKDLDYIEKL